MRLLLAIFLMSSGCVASDGLGADTGVVMVWGGGGEPVKLVVAAACFGGECEEVAQLGAKLLGRHLMEEVGRPVEVRLGRTEDEMRAALGGDVVMMTGDVWMRGEGDGEGMEAVMQSRVAGTGASSWVLLVRAPLDELAVSRGHVVVAGEGDGELPMMWLNGWRKSRGLVVEPPPRTHRITREPRAAIGLLRTFFGKADACVVPERVFVEACDHNPEVGKRLTRLAASPPLPGAVVAVKAGDGGKGGQDLRRAVERLESTAHGTALASLLEVRAFGPFSAADWPAVATLGGKWSPAARPVPAAVASGVQGQSGRPSAP